MTFTTVGLTQFMSTGAYVALGRQVGLHGHGMLDHELGPDLAEQVEGGDASHLPGRVHPLALHRGVHGTLNQRTNHQCLYDAGKHVDKHSFFIGRQRNTPARDSSYLRMCSTRLSTS